MMRREVRLLQLIKRSGKFLILSYLLGSNLALSSDNWLGKCAAPTADSTRLKMWLLQQIARDSEALDPGKLAHTYGNKTSHQLVVCWNPKRFTRSPLFPVRGGSAQ